MIWRLVTATAISGALSEPVVSLNETPAVAETSAIPSVTMPLAAITLSDDAILGVVAVIMSPAACAFAPVAAGKVAAKSMTGPVALLEPFTSTSTLVAWSVRPGTPTRAIESAEAVRA